MGNESGSCEINIQSDIPQPPPSEEYPGEPAGDVCKAVMELCENEGVDGDLCAMALQMCNNFGAVTTNVEPPPDLVPPSCAISFAAGVQACAELDALSEADAIGADELGLVVDEHCYGPDVEDDFIHGMEMCECFVPEPWTWEPIEEPCMADDIDFELRDADEPYACPTYAGAADGSASVEAPPMDESDDMVIGEPMEPFMPHVEPICVCYRVIDHCEPVPPPCRAPYGDGCDDPGVPPCPEPDAPNCGLEPVPEPGECIIEEGEVDGEFFQTGICAVE
jgi:hypothetical protein